jgi:glycosyltransferase A (GT-A) superfamily protein (DUF2064 family)
VGQDYAQSRRVAAAFYHHARRAVADSGLPTIEVNGAQQRGRNFGARLANAVADAFAAGYEHVIAVGNDCPALHEVDWAAVTEQLEAGRPVLGPTSGSPAISLSTRRLRRFRGRPTGCFRPYTATSWPRPGPRPPVSPCATM